MKFSILIPHYKNGKVTAHAISKLLEYKGSHEIDILVIDNNAGDGSLEYLKPFRSSIKYQAYPKDMLGSHGIAFDYILPHIHDEWFITIESDSYPTEHGWLDYYEQIMKQGYDGAGSVLHLSGGQYMHPCGALYNKKIWQEAKRYCNAVQYAYFPNMNVKDGFDSHCMIHKSIVEEVMKSPYDFIEPAHGYRGLGRMGMVEKLMYYSPTVAPFHNGMGRANESVKTYGQRTIQTEVPQILLTDKPKIINRVGYEPGQWLTYFMLAIGKKLFYIPTETKWMPNRENQQQEYTKMANGFTHVWAGSSYLDMDGGEYDDVYQFKKNQIEELYNSLPKNQKIK